MSTKRDYSWQKRNWNGPSQFGKQKDTHQPKPTSFNQIIECIEYRKIPIKPLVFKYPSGYEYEKKMIERNKKQISQGKTWKEKIQDIQIPREIKWLIEEDIDKGSQSLSNFLNKRVVVNISGKYDSMLRKINNEGYYIPCGAGAFEEKRYSRGAPQQKVFEPIEKISEEINDKVDETIISLNVLPRINHYIHSAEQHTRIVHDYCECCQHAEPSVSNTYGTGKKSSKKTKGRHSRKKLELYHESKGNDLFLTNEQF